MLPRLRRYGTVSGKGYLPHEVVKAVVFWTLTGCVLLATGAGLLMTLGGLDSNWAGRLVSCAAILGSGSLVFLFINCLFGELGSSLFSRSDHPPMDPAFGERLRKAKLGSKEETDSLAS